MRNILKLMVLVPLFLTACDDMFSPAIDNIRSLDAMYKEPTFAQGLLANAYILLPYSSSPSTDVATDDAVTNNINDGYLKMATGSWAANNDPMSQWQARKNAIQYLNLFLENTDKVTWSNTDNISKMFNDRLKGEAYALRALQMFYLLKAHGGWTADGKLMGVPIVTNSEDVNSDFNQPRNTFQECIDQINSDITKALELLPLDFSDLTSSADIPSKYQTIGITNVGDYNRVFGDIVKGRLTSRIVEAIKAQVALMAASPAFSAGTTVTWQNAADAAAAVLDRIGGLSGLSSNGGTWYYNKITSGGTTYVETDKLGAGRNPAEILWRSGIGTNNSLEADNFPPTLDGKGRINPTQNLVDAFPMIDGYPINESSVNYKYSSTDPYANRDPRLKKYILVNGGTQGSNNKVIYTGTFDIVVNNVPVTNKDGLNKEDGFSTRTGYYLLKLLRPDCNPSPSYNTQQKHYTAYIRYTEIFLDYAEAANEAYGPMGNGTHSYSAYDVIKAIRLRAGIANDPYLESIKTDKDKMRQLIRNERRIELCFENHRFYDLRRWQANLNETARGVQIDKPSSSYVFTPIDVESRNYKDYMNYGPIPYNEMLKWSNLEQNKGW